MGRLMLSPLSLSGRARIPGRHRLPGLLWILLRDANARRGGPSARFPWRVSDARRGEPGARLTSLRGHMPLLGRLTGRPRLVLGHWREAGCRSPKPLRGPTAAPPLRSNEGGTYGCRWLRCLASCDAVAHCPCLGKDTDVGRGRPGAPEGLERTRSSRR